MKIEARLVLVVSPSCRAPIVPLVYHLYGPSRLLRKRSERPCDTRAISAMNSRRLIVSPVPRRNRALVLIYFGYPQAHEDDAERAVRAGLALIEAVGELASVEPLQIRIGVGTGVVSRLTHKAENGFRALRLIICGSMRSPMRLTRTNVTQGPSVLTFTLTDRNGAVCVRA
jgi:hypothetical protein